jgi:hypothetical protein
MFTNLRRIGLFSAFMNNKKIMCSCIFIYVMHFTISAIHATIKMMFYYSRIDTVVNGSCCVALANHQIT